MKITLRPLFNDQWSGLKGKYRNCHEDLTPYWTRSGRIYTGLTPRDEVRLSEVTGLDLAVGSEYWSNFFIRTGTKDYFLDTSDPTDEIKWLFLKGHRRVKSSINEKKATANYVLVNKEEEAIRDNTINKQKRIAFRAFDQMSPTEVRKALRLFGENADELNTEVAEQRMFDLVEANPTRFLDKWVNNDSRETEVLLERAMARNIVRKSGALYKYGSDVIGRLKEEAIDFLDNPKNQDIKRTILVELDAKDYIQDREVTEDTSSKIQELLDENEVIEKEIEEKEIITNNVPDGIDGAEVILEAGSLKVTKEPVSKKSKK